MPIPVEILFNGDIVLSSEGKDVLLTKEEYNKLVRQLNCMRELLAELCTESQKHSRFFQSMYDNTLQVIE